MPRSIPSSSSGKAGPGRWHKAISLQSAVFVDTVDALHEAGDLVDPIQNGVFV
jgi:hypothetical protein